MRHDEDRACFDCALDRCDRCLAADPNPPGRRECCCGALDDRHDARKD